MTGPDRLRAWGAHLAVAMGFLALSAAWSWPTVGLPLDVLPMRHFDVYPTLWLLARGPDTLPGLVHPESAWPIGETLVRADSYVLLGIGALVEGWLSPLAVVRALVVLGPAVNAMAAERCAAVGFGVSRPASIVAGVAYGFSGIAASALLEGHVYHLLNPWLPLLWLCWRKGVAAGPGAAAAWGLGVGASFALALLTTGYFGVFAGLLLGVALTSQPVRGARVLPTAALVAGPVVWAWVGWFRSGGGWVDRGPAPDLFLVQGAQTLSELVGLTARADLVGHSIATPVGWTVLWLFLLTPLVRPGRWLLAWTFGLGALLATLGRVWAWAPGEVLLTLPTEALRAIPGVELFRFPVRFFWLFALVGGVLASRVLERLTERRPGVGWGIVAWLAVEAVVGVALPWRVGRQIGATPSAYAAAPEGQAILDLFPRPVDGSAGEIEPWVRGLGCAYQAHHGRPILELCIGTGVRSPREVAERWLLRRLFDGTPAESIAATLGDLGVGAVAVHPDWARDSDAALWTSRMGEVFAPLASSEDGGERVRLFRVPPGDPSRRQAAWALLSEGGGTTGAAPGPR